MLTFSGHGLLYSFLVGNSFSAWLLTGGDVTARLPNNLKACADFSLLVYAGEGVTTADGVSSAVTSVMSRGVP